MSGNAQATATASSSGIGLFGLTFIVLLVLKLTGVAELAWWVVFLPLMIGFGLFLLLLAVVLLVAIFDR